MKNIIFIPVLVVPLLFLGCSAPSQRKGFDVLITGGAIYDGTSREPYVADIGIIADKIVARS